MKRKKYFFIALFLIALPIAALQLLGHAPVKKNKTPVVKKAAPTAVDPTLQALVHDFEKEFVTLMQSSGTPGASVAIVQDSTILFIQGYGVKKIGTLDSIDINTVYRIGSVSKPFASFLTGILVQDSVLHWNDLVTQYVPSFALKSPEQTHLLSIQHVLSHTTGLPYHTYTNLVEEGRPLPELLSKLKDVDLSGSVGKQYSYQNVAYSVIAEVMKAATGKTYETLMTERVFFPLHMTTASIDYASLKANPNIAYPHVIRRHGYVPSSITDTYYNVSPAGGVNASIHDMAQWMKALLNQRHDVISGETLNHLYSPFIEAPSKNRKYRQVDPIQKSFYGLGWRVLQYPTDTILYHGGYVNGYRSEIGLSPKDHIAICVLANAPGPLADNAIPIFFHLYRSRLDSLRARTTNKTLAVP